MNFSTKKSVRATALTIVCAILFWAAVCIPLNIVGREAVDFDPRQCPRNVDAYDEYLCAGVDLTRLEASAEPGKPAFAVTYAPAYPLDRTFDARLVYTAAASGEFQASLSYRVLGIQEEGPEGSAERDYTLLAEYTDLIVDGRCEDSPSASNLSPDCNFISLYHCSGIVYAAYRIEFYSAGLVGATPVSGAHLIFTASGANAGALAISLRAVFCVLAGLVVVFPVILFIKYPSYFGGYRSPRSGTQKSLRDSIMAFSVCGSLAFGPFMFFQYYAAPAVFALIEGILIRAFMVAAACFVLFLSRARPGVEELSTGASGAGKGKSARKGRPGASGVSGEPNDPDELEGEENRFRPEELNDGSEDSQEARAAARSSPPGCSPERRSAAIIGTSAGMGLLYIAADAIFLYWNSYAVSGEADLVLELGQIFGTLAGALGAASVLSAGAGVHSLIRRARKGGRKDDESFGDWTSYFAFTIILGVMYAVAGLVSSWAVGYGDRVFGFADSLLYVLLLAFYLRYVGVEAAVGVFSGRKATDADPRAKKHLLENEEDA